MLSRRSVGLKHKPSFASVYSKAYLAHTYNLNYSFMSQMKWARVKKSINEGKKITNKKIGDTTKKNQCSENSTSKIYLSQLYSYVHIAFQNVQPLLASYKVHRYVQVNHLVHVKPFFLVYSHCRTNPHTFGNDAEIPQ